jgi:hypothetical protein
MKCAAKVYVSGFTVLQEVTEVLSFCNEVVRKVAIGYISACPSEMGTKAQRFVYCKAPTLGARCTHQINKFFFLTLSYPSKIKGYLYHQRVSPPLKKMP